MSIATTDRKAGPFLGDDVTAVFPFEFKVYDAEHLKVILTSATGVESELVLDAGYAVSLNADQEDNPGGNVVLVNPLATGEKLTIITDQPATQEAVLTNMGGFFPKTIEKRFDWLTILVQQLTEKVNRSLKVGASDDSPNTDIGTAAQRAGKTIVFDANGDVDFAVVEAPLTTQTAFNSLLSTVAESVWSSVLDSWIGAAANSLFKLIHPRTAAEIAAGVAIVNPIYRPGDIRRYGTTDPIGAESSNDAIQAAVAVARQNKGRVFIPSGRWRFTETILIDDTITLEGEDTDGAVLLKDGNFVGIEINTAPTSAAQPTLRNFTLDSAGGSDASPGIQINEFRAHIKQVTVQNQGSHGIECLYSNLSYLADLKLLNNAGDGLKLNGTTSPDTNAMTIINVDARGNGGWGINLEAGWANFIWGCQTSFNTGGGIRFNNARSNIVFIYSEANTGSSCKFEDHATCVGNLVFINEGFPTFNGSTADSNTVVRHQRGPVYDFNFNKVTADKFILPNVLQDGTQVRGILTAQHTVDDRFDFVASGSGAGTFPRVRLIGPDAPTTPLSFETDGRVFAALGLYPAGDTGPFWQAGSGNPNGNIAAPIGSLWSDTTNGVLYFKAGGGGGNTGWVAVTLAS